MTYQTNIRPHPSLERPENDLSKSRETWKWLKTKIRPHPSLEWMNEWILIATCKHLVWSTRIGRNMPIWIRLENDSSKSRETWKWLIQVLRDLKMTRQNTLFNTKMQRHRRGGSPLDYMIFISGYRMHHRQRIPTDLPAYDCEREFCDKTNKIKFGEFAKAYLKTKCWHCEVI